MLGGSRKRQVCFSRTSSSGRANTLWKQTDRICDFLSESRGGLSLLFGGTGREGGVSGLVTAKAPPARIDRVGESQAAAPHTVLLLTGDSRVRVCIPGLQGFLGGGVPPQFVRD